MRFHHQSEILLRLILGRYLDRCPIHSSCPLNWLLHSLPQVLLLNYLWKSLIFGKWTSSSTPHTVNPCTFPGNILQKILHNCTNKWCSFFWFIAHIFNILYFKNVILYFIFVSWSLQYLFFFYFYVLMSLFIAQHTSEYSLYVKTRFWFHLQVVFIVSEACSTFRAKNCMKSSTKTYQTNCQVIP